jgi:hypothetical protein
VGSCVIRSSSWAKWSISMSIRYADRQRFQAMAKAMRMTIVIGITMAMNVLMALGVKKVLSVWVVMSVVVAVREGDASLMR